MEIRFNQERESILSHIVAIPNDFDTLENAYKLV
jgi:hypothetical protein